MPASLSRNYAMKVALQNKTGLSTNASINDLSVAYFGGKVSQNDALRAWLQSKTGLTGVQSINDLWRQYFIGKGVANQVSLTDMANQYFTLQALP